MSKKLLTIGIPTYNRPENLLKILNTIQKFPKNKVDILICDDSSNQNVSKVIKKKKLKNLKYFKNKINLGFSKNVRKIYVKSKTEYLWIICDDDIILDSAYKIIEKKIYDKKPEIIYFNAIRDTIFTKKGKIISKNLFTTEPNKIFYDNFWKGVFLSIIIFKKNKKISELILKKNVEKNVFVQLTIVLMTLEQNLKFLLSKESIVKRIPGFKYGDYYRFIITDPIDSISRTRFKYSKKKLFDSWGKQFFVWIVIFAASRVNLIHYSSFNQTKAKKIIFKYFPIKGPILIFLLNIINIIPRIFLKFLLLVIFFIKLGLKGPAKYKEKFEQFKKDKRDTKFNEYI